MGDGEAQQRWPAVACTQSCAASLIRPGTITLSPNVSGILGRQTIGIFVVRRTGGTRTVLGVKQPRIKVVGRVPLGKASGAATASAGI